jgi:predicted AlkP superfamily phosphohydrolase/phosphomutase
MLDEVLLRLEGVPSPRRRQHIAQRMIANWTRLPRGFRTLLTPLHKAFWPKLKANLVQPRKSKRRFFEIIVNDAAAGVRLNVRGREPDGVVEPGADYQATCAMLEHELGCLLDPATGRRIVDRVLRPQVLYPGENADRLPDLQVVWNRERPITGATSERVGDVTQQFVFASHRTGDHPEEDGLFFFVGPGVRPGRVSGVSVQDLGPTIVSMFGAAMAGVDGKVVTSLYAPEISADGDFVCRDPLP